MRATTTPLPAGPAPALPECAVELPTRYGSFWFDSRDEKLTPWIRRHATWEADVLRFFRSAVRPGATVVDVGANVGFHTVVLSQLVGPGGHVHAFEPLPVTLELLRANVWRHRSSNVVVHPRAASDRSGPVAMHIDPEGRSGAQLAPAGTAPELVVDAVTLAEALGATRVDLLKLDVEGAEPLVLAGASEILAASPDLLAVVEFRSRTHLDGRDGEDVLSFYEGLGFELRLLRADGRTVPAGRDAVLAEARAHETLNIVLRR